MNYTGKHRIDLKFLLIGVSGLILFGYFCYLCFDDAAYYEMITAGRRHILDYVARPVIQLLAAISVITIIAMLVIFPVAALRGNTAFEINADGIHTWPIFGKPRFLAWREMRSSRLIADVLNVWPQYDSSSKAISIALYGHDRETLYITIAHYRPDIAEVLAKAG